MTRNRWVRRPAKLKAGVETSKNRLSPLCPPEGVVDHMHEAELGRGRAGGVRKQPAGPLHACLTWCRGPRLAIPANPHSQRPPKGKVSGHERACIVGRPSADPKAARVRGGVWNLWAPNPGVFCLGGQFAGLRTKQIMQCGLPS